MIYVKLFLLVETLLIFGLALRRNPDPFSPVKFYLVFTGFFNLSIYFSEVMPETLFCYFALIQFIAVCVFVEKKCVLKTISVSAETCAVINQAVWVLTIPPVAVMLYYLYDAGSLSAYLGVLSKRVELWRGEGVLTVLLNMLPVLNLVYFGSVAATRKTNRKNLYLYALHFILFFIVGLLTASRSYIGVSILGMCVVWAHLVRIPRLRYLFAVSVLLLLFVGFTGAIRNYYNVGMTFDSVMKVVEKAKFETAQMGYGVSPLEVIFKSPERVHLGGATYLTLITNVVPRYFWPEKPDTGGIIFTREYTEDQSGLSYYATGAVTEAVLNFGKKIGVPVGLILNFMLLISGCLFYNRTFCEDCKCDRNTGLLLVVVYYYAILSLSKFSYGEFTDIFQTLIFFNLVPLLLIRFALLIDKYKKSSTLSDQ